MADECINCFKASEIKRMQEDILEGKNNNKEMLKNVSDIKESHTQTRFYMEQIKINQDAMALVSEKHQIAMTLATERNQDLVARTNKENKDAMEAGFKVIADKKAEEEKAVMEKKKADEIEHKRLNEKNVQEKKDRAKEKKMRTWGLILLAVSWIASNLFGILKIYFPHMIGLVK